MRVCQTWYVVVSYVWYVLIVTARSAGGPTYMEMIEEMDKELSKVIEDFDRAVIVEALRETSELSFFQYVDSSYSRVQLRAGASRAGASRASTSRARVFIQTS